MKGILTGLGGQGLHWLGDVVKYEGCDLVAFVEPNEANRTRAVEQKGIARETIFDSLEDAVKNVQADFVLDVTPPTIHHQIAEVAFANGLHVLGEKPLSDNFETAKRVVAVGERAGAKHMITQNYRFGAQPRTTRRVLDEGLIGQPGQCDIRFYMPWADSPSSHYVTQPFMLINDMMVHHFDMLRYVLNNDPQSVQAITWNQPWGWHAGDAAHAIVFRYADGLVTTHTSVGCAVGSQTSYNGDWRIEGPQGSIDWADDKTTVSRLHRTEEKVDHQPLADDNVPPQRQAILDEFFSSIRDHREPECSARDNLKSLAMVFAAIQSSKEDRRVELSEFSL